MRAFKALRDQHGLIEHAYIEKNPDKMYKSSSSVRSPPDIIINADGFNALIECKTRQGPSIAFNRLSAGQHDYLEEYSRIPGPYYGVVAVMFYDKSPKNRSMNYRIYYIDIQAWRLLERDSPRKSLNEKILQDCINKKRYQKGLGISFVQGKNSLGLNFPEHILEVIKNARN